MMSEQRMIEALRECRHCGWMCKPNSTPEKSCYPLAAPSGWKLVPVEPTPEMIEMGVDANGTSWDETTDQGFPQQVAQDIYRAMLDAAPVAPADAPPVAWIRMDHLRQAQRAPFMCRVEPSHRPGFDLVPLFAAPSPKPAASAQKGLTNERIREIFWNIRDAEKGDYLQFARALLREVEGSDHE